MSSKRSFLPLFWIGVVLLLGVTSWFGWRALSSAKPGNGGGGPGGERPPAAVIVTPAEEREVVESLSVTGTLRAVRRAEVAARESAAVDALQVDEGDLVEEGEVLATLDPRRLEALIQEAAASLTAAEAELAQREAELERARLDEKMISDLWNDRAVAEREFLDSVRELKVAEAQVNARVEAIEAARKRSELLAVRRTDLEIRAPFAGRVVTLHTEVGEWLREGDPVVTLISTGEAEAWLQLPERHAAVMRQTSPEAVEIRLPGRSEPLQADDLSLIPDIDGRSRRFTLVAHLPDPDNALTPGTSVTASVPLGKPQRRIVVPSDAILKSYDGSYVYTPRTGPEGPPLAQRVSVEVLFERQGESILSPGTLQAGDPVIIEGNERLFPNTPVNPQSPEARNQGAGPGKAAAR